MSVRSRGGEHGFTLIEVLLASALFVFVAFAGFEAIRMLALHVTVLAQRAHAASELTVAAAALRSDALSSAAVWKPASSCGDAVALMQKEAGNATSFLLYVARPVAGSTALTLFRATSASGAMNPCDPALVLDPLVENIAGFHVTSVLATDLTAHADAVSGNADGAIFRSSGLSAVAVDSHERDFDGTPIVTGNSVTEVSVDGDPALTTLDLVAGNRPSGFTSVLAYACGARCESTRVFPETRGGDLTACSISYDLPDTPAFYAPAAGQPVYVAASGGRLQPVITAYAVNAGAVFTFTGPGGAHASEELYVNDPSWSVPGMQDAPAIGADGSVNADYTLNAVKRAGAAKIFADANGATLLASQLAICTGMNAETNDFRG